MKMENIILANYKMISFGKIQSTQTYAHELIAYGTASDKTVILADSQISGRGRYRRTWVSPVGNLYVSFIYNVEERDPKLSYAVAVAVAESLISFDINPNIKWPNDILINGEKVSGILIEYSKNFVIIGIGVNIKSSPKIDEYKTTSLHKYAKINRDELLSVIIKKLDFWMIKDFSIVRKRWMDLAVGLNKTVKYRGGEVELIEINKDGALVLRNGTEYIMTYGDEISI